MKCHRLSHGSRTVSCPLPGACARCLLKLFALQVKEKEGRLVGSSYSWENGQRVHHRVFFLLLYSFSSVAVEGRKKRRRKREKM